jgi:hypothetical protein
MPCGVLNIPPFVSARSPNIASNFRSFKYFSWRRLNSSDFRQVSGKSHQRFHPQHGFAEHLRADAVPTMAHRFTIAHDCGPAIAKFQSGFSCYGNDVSAAIACVESGNATGLPVLADNRAAHPVSATIAEFVKLSGDGVRVRTHWRKCSTAEPI